MKPHSTKIFRDMINGIGAFIQSQFMNPPGGPSAQGIVDPIVVYVGGYYKTNICFKFKHTLYNLI